MREKLLNKPKNKHITQTKSVSNYLKFYYPEALILFAVILLLGIRLNHFQSNGDEASLLYWGWVLKNGGPYLGYIDGAAPLFSFLASYTLRVFDNPLFAGRIISFSAAILGVSGTYLLVKSLRGRFAAIISSMLYATLPITFFYHRFAFRESLLIMAGIYVLLFSNYLIKNKSKRWLYMISTAMSLTIGFFAKQHAIIFFAYPLITYLADMFRLSKRLSNKIKEILLSYLFSLIFISIIIISQYKAISTMKGWGGNVATQAILGGNYLYNFRTNILTLGEVLYLYFGVILLFLLVYLFIQSIKQKKYYYLFLILYPILIVSIYSLANPDFFSQTRYLVPVFLPWYLLPGIALSDLIENIKIYFANIKILIVSSLVVLILLFYPSFNFIYKYFGKPEKTPFVKSDRTIYVQNSGFDTFEAFDYLKRLSEVRPIFVIVEPGSGPKNWPFMLFEKNPNIKVARWPGFRTTSLSPYINKPAYAVLDDDPKGDSRVDFIQANPDAKLIKRYWRPGNKIYIDIMLIEPGKK